MTSLLFFCHVPAISFNYRLLLRMHDGLTPTPTKHALKRSE